LPDLLAVLCSFCTKFSIPVRRIVVLLVCQERSDVNMPLGSLLIRCFCVVNDCDEPVAVLPNVENYVSLHIVGIFERAANFWKIVPSNLFDENHPCFDLVRGIWMLQHGIVQMLTRNDMHHQIILHNM
jgi:hypothetical protein